MSNLRRSRPDEQDDLLRRLQEISITRHRLDATDQASPLSPRRLQQLYDPEYQNVCELSPGDTSPLQDAFDLVFHPDVTPKLPSPVSPKPRTKLNLDFSRENSPRESLSENCLSVAADVPSFRAAQLQLSLTDDNKWETLHSLLVAMKDEPFDVEESLKALPTSQGARPGQLSTQEELQIQLAAVQDVLEDERLELRQTQQERDAALAYIHNLKVNGKDTLPAREPGNEIINLYKLGIDSLRDPSVSKNSVIDLLLPVVRELHKQKAYLDRLVTVALMRVPWILEEVDSMDLPDPETPLFSMDKNEEWR